MTPEYVCHLHLREIAKDAEVDYSRMITLDFPPFVGLVLSFNEEEVILFDCNNITYDASPEGGAFWIHSTDDSLECPCNPEDGCCRSSMSVYEKHGWKIEDVRRGSSRIYRRDLTFSDQDSIECGEGGRYYVDHDAPYHDDSKRMPNLNKPVQPALAGEKREG